MKALIIENRIKLFVDDRQRVNLIGIVPKGNIQRMKELTGCKILSVEKHTASFNHNAGELCRIVYRVELCNILPYLKHSDSARYCENAKEYANLLGVSIHDLGYCFLYLLTDKLPLYAFGYPKKPKTKTGMSIYQDINGKRISLHRNERYIKKFGRWFSLKSSI